MARRNKPTASQSPWCPKPRLRSQKPDDGDTIGTPKLPRDPELHSREHGK
jgi:hypothetical protein